MNISKCFYFSLLVLNMAVPRAVHAEPSVGQEQYGESSSFKNEYFYLLSALKSKIPEQIKLIQMVNGNVRSSDTLKQHAHGLQRIIDDVMKLNISREDLSAQTNNEVRDNLISLKNFAVEADDSERLLVRDLSALPGQDINAQAIVESAKQQVEQSASFISEQSTKGLEKAKTYQKLRADLTATRGGTTSHVLPFYLVEKTERQFQKNVNFDYLLDTVRHNNQEMKKIILDLNRLNLSEPAKQEYIKILESYILHTQYITANILNKTYKNGVSPLWKNRFMGTTRANIAVLFNRVVNSTPKKQSLKSSQKGEAIESPSLSPPSALISRDAVGSDSINLLSASETLLEAQENQSKVQKLLQKKSKKKSESGTYESNPPKGRKPNFLKVPGSDEFNAQSQSKEITPGVHVPEDWSEAQELSTYLLNKKQSFASSKIEELLRKYEILQKNLANGGYLLGPKVFRKDLDDFKDRAAKIRDEIERHHALPTDDVKDKTVVSNNRSSSGRRDKTFAVEGSPSAISGDDQMVTALPAVK